MRCGKAALIMMPPSECPMKDSLKNKKKKKISLRITCEDYLLDTIPK